MGKRIITIEELRCNIELQQFEFGCSGFTIVERLKFRTNEYTVEDLLIDIEDDCILFYSSTDDFRGKFLQIVFNDWMSIIEYSKINKLINIVIHTKYGEIYINAIN